jgi:outer membrane protein assembly factor BamB
VRPARTVSCPLCGHAWPARTSRFCGRCGEALRAVAGARPRRRSSRATVVAGGAGLISVALFGVAGLGSTLADAVAARPEPQVELPAASELPQQRGLTAEEARAALAPFDPDRLRCEPEGCERWRLDLPVGVEDVGRLGELLVLQLDDELVAIEAASGERRWTAPLDPEGRVARRGDLGRPRLLAADDIHLGVGHESGDLQVLDRDGQLRWSARLPPPSWIWELHVLEDVLVTVGPPPSPAEGSTQLHAFDISDGSPRWSQVVRDVIPPLHDLLAITEDGTLVRLAPETGEITADFGEASWASPLTDRLLLIWQDSGPETARVVGTERGERLLGFEGMVETILEGDDATFLQVQVDRLPPEREIVALEADGQVRWRRTVPLDLRERCCAALVMTDDGGLFVAEPEGAGRVLDASTGADRPHLDPPPIPVGDWWTGKVSIRHDDDRQMTITDASGSARITSKMAWLLLDDPVVLASQDGLLGVDLVSPPVGPRPPTRLPAS